MRSFARILPGLQSGVSSNAVALLLPCGGSLGNPHAFSMTEHFEHCASFINTVGGFLLVVGTLVALLESVRLFICNPAGKRKSHLSFPGQRGWGPLSLDAIRLQLGFIVTLSLQVMVSVDLLDAVTRCRFVLHFCMFLTVVLIRTILDYFLSTELEELEHRVIQTCF